MKKMLFLSFLAMLATANAQVQGDAGIPERATHSLNLDLDAEGFFFNAEYATPFAKGYTVTGFRLSPSLVYGINEHAQLRVGFNATLFAGLDSLYLLRPTMTLIYNPTDWLSFVAGTLLDDNHHKLPAPVVDPSRHFFNYQEDGIQILTKTKIWKSDTWLDWTHYLTPWTPDQELFTMGSKHELTLMTLGREYYLKNPEDSLPPFFSHARYFIVSLPAHFIASHRGGEVKTIDTNTVTTFNESVGLRFEYSFCHSENSTSHIALELPVYFYHLDNKELDDGGKAFYPTLTYAWTRSHHDPELSTLNSQLSIVNSIGFWHGDHYFSRYGSPFFWSINPYSSLHMPAGASTLDADIRNAITYSLSVEHTFKDIALGLKVDAFHDLDLKKNDFLFSFFLRYNGLIKLL